MQGWLDGWEITKLHGAAGRCGAPESVLFFFEGVEWSAMNSDVETEERGRPTDADFGQFRRPVVFFGRRRVDLASIGSA